MKKFVLLCMLFITFQSHGNGIIVSQVSYNENNNQLSFTLTWENSWSFGHLRPELWDAAWVYVKYAPNGGDSWFHAEMVDSIPEPDYLLNISGDDLGVTIWKNIPSPGTSGTFGPQEFTVELAPMTGAYQDFKVFATEMVYIADDDFYAGDGTSSGRFHQGNDVNMPWFITSEDAITRGSTAGEFDQQGSLSTQDLSADFPKGWTSFWCMKYKITAQQYTDFLNCLTRTQQDARTHADLSGLTASNKYVMTNTASVQDRNPIACNVAIGTGPIEFFVDMDPTNPPNSANDGANVVLNHLTTIDIIAFMDWAGLRPITELEYEKITRGLAPTVAGEYAWGTDTRSAAGGILNPGSANESTTNVGINPSLYRLEPLRAGYAATSTSTRSESCATFWGIMDVHNLGEFMYGVESLNFTKYSYGDGNLSAFGGAVVTGWTVGAQLLCAQDPVAPGIEPISKGKYVITPTTRSAYMGARGIRKSYID